jgi:predicted RNase H-like HicB family nuclease
MLTPYIQAAMARAQYDKLDDGSFYGEIPGLNGLYANAATLEGCRSDLQRSLEDWIVFGLTNGIPIPPIDGFELSAAKIA